MQLDYRRLTLLHLYLYKKFRIYLCLLQHNETIKKMNKAISLKQKFKGYVIELCAKKVKKIAVVYCKGVRNKIFGNFFSLARSFNPFGLQLKRNYCLINFKTRLHIQVLSYYMYLKLSRVIYQIKKKMLYKYY